MHFTAAMIAFIAGDEIDSNITRLEDLGCTAFLKPVSFFPTDKVGTCYGARFVIVFTLKFYVHNGLTQPLTALKQGICEKKRV